VNRKVNERVNRVFHAAFTLPRCTGEIETLDRAIQVRTIKPATITEALKKENVNDNFALYRCFTRNLSYLTSGLSGPSTYLRNIETGKSKKNLSSRRQIESESGK
jgi:hypothetical protein